MEKAKIIDNQVSFLAIDASCPLNLEKVRIKDIIENIPSGVVVVEKPADSHLRQQKSHRTPRR